MQSQRAISPTIKAFKVRLGVIQPYSSRLCRKVVVEYGPRGGVGLGKMMALVNVYFQQMIKITSACGGDVIKFAGDALIVLWTEGTQSTKAHRACECAMELQDVLHNAQMTADLQLSLKIGVGVGSGIGW